MTVYEAIYARRDVRDFRPDPVPDEVLRRILDAAHHAGSVGFMQPWNFVIVRSLEVRRRVLDVFEHENRRAADNYLGERRECYESLKLQGIVDAPLNLAVTCDRTRRGPHVLGRNSMIDTDVYSTCCAIQNLWLAARAENIGVGWVSILDVEAVKTLLGIPPEVLLVAYLCLGYPVEFRAQPLLEEVGWEKRTPLQEVIFEDAWGRGMKSQDPNPNNKQNQNHNIKDGSVSLIVILNLFEFWHLLFEISRSRKAWSRGR